MLAYADFVLDEDPAGTAWLPMLYCYITESQRRSGAAYSWIWTRAVFIGHLSTRASGLFPGPTYGSRLQERLGALPGRLARGHVPLVAAGPGSRGVGGMRHSGALRRSRPAGGVARNGKSS